MLSLHFFSTGVDLPNLGDPVSFFVDLHGLPSEELTRFLTYLNCYMTYFDARSPRVLIHEELPPISERLRDRYCRETFPEQIVAGQIDDNIMAYWLGAAMTANSVLKFLLLYRMIEYAAFSYLDPISKQKIKILLSAPDAISRMDDITRDVAGIVASAKATEDIPKAEALVGAAVSADKVWKEIEQDREYFSRDHCFDGGYTVKALISNNGDLEGLLPNYPRAVLDRLRGIRNALAHGQDTKTSLTIRPTSRNARSMRPWLNVIETIAAEVMLYRQVI